MTEKQINNIAQKLVSTSIKLHDKKELGKMNLLTFFKEQLKELYDSEYYNDIIIKYCNLLAQAGYEIMIDTEKFDIIDYNSNEYIRYVEKIISKRPKNYAKLQEQAKKTANEIIKLYKSKKYIDKSYNDYLQYTIPQNFSSREKSIIEVNAIHFITEKYYDIDNTNPLILSKF